MFFKTKARRRREILAAPFPAAWMDHLRKNVAMFALLSDAERAKLCDDLRIFIAEKSWEGCGGLQLTDEMKVTIAAQACLLLLGVEHDYFSRVETILVYPAAFESAQGMVGPGGIVHEGVGMTGQAWHRGPVILDWESVREDGRRHRDGRNVVLHEFAHQLDFLDGYADGTPPLHNRQHREWQEVMTAEWNRLVDDVDSGKASVLDEYGAQSAVEFFAVATECFFEKPVELRRRHPRLYDVLLAYYRQDPCLRFSSPID
jgi:Mlc titration factor MtfA (ptsG expression regulator)